jgi:Fe-S-cluster containining protein
MVKRGPEKPAALKPSPCHLCTGRCCRYVALEIDRPVTPEEHDQVRWYLVHEGTVVWVEKGSWFLEMATPCRNLTATGACGIYESRPGICREYGSPASEADCEYFEEGLAFDLRFETAEAFEAWSREDLARSEERLRRRRERRRARHAPPREATA